MLPVDDEKAGTFYGDEEVVTSVLPAVGVADSDGAVFFDDGPPFDGAGR